MMHTVMMVPCGNQIGLVTDSTEAEVLPSKAPGHNLGKGRNEKEGIKV